MRLAAAQLALLFCVSSPGFAQPPVGSAESPAAKTGDSMVLIRGGAFEMGIDAADIPRLEKIFAIENGKLFADELPRHSVAVKDFYLDKNLVSNAQFKSFLDANPQFGPDRFPQGLDNGNYLEHWNRPDHDSAKPDHPVVNVNWYAAVEYCHWAGKRLPSEAEWEFAARGGRDALFPWGDELPDPSRANFNNNVGTTTPVGAYPANPYGLFDMAGNVWQFLSGKWAPYPSGRQGGKRQGAHAKRHTADGSEILADLYPEAPRRTIRGGSFAGHPVNLWVQYRDSHPANGSEPFVGFRCAKSAASGTP
jgi:formylglycine-generating enzyme required for sulfatase activity